VWSFQERLSFKLWRTKNSNSCSNLFGKKPRLYSRAEFLLSRKQKSLNRSGKSFLRMWPWQSETGLTTSTWSFKLTSEWALWAKKASKPHLQPTSPSNNFGSWDPWCSCMVAKPTGATRCWCPSLSTRTYSTWWLSTISASSPDGAARLFTNRLSTSCTTSQWPRSPLCGSH